MRKYAAEGMRAKMSVISSLKEKNFEEDPGGSKWQWPKKQKRVWKI
jgi:hypothetical protein